MGVGLEAAIPLFVFAGTVLAVQAVLSLIARRNSRAEERLAESGPGPLVRRAYLRRAAEKPKSMLPERIRAVVERAQALSDPLMPAAEVEQDELKVRLANAGFRGDEAVRVYLGLRVVSLLVFSALGLAAALPLCGFTAAALGWVIALAGLGFLLPPAVVGHLRARRQQEIYRTLPDVLDLLGICLVSGLHMDAALRHVYDGLGDYARALREELAVALLQLQLGRPRRAVLHDLGVRTGVDDVRSLAALLVQADRLGVPIADALRAHSNAMRTRRRHRAQEKAAKTAVQVIFPLVLFIFPGIFVVVCGPAVLKVGLWPMVGDW